MNKSLTVKNLRRKGYKIYINHYRRSILNNELIPLYEFKITQNQHLIDACGGLTTMEVIDPSGYKVMAEVSCYFKDAFNKKIANSICLGRAMKALKEIKNIKI